MTENDNEKKTIKELEKKIAQKELQIQTLMKQCVKFSDQVKTLIKKGQEQLSFIQTLYKKIVPSQLPQIKGIQMSLKFKAGKLFTSDYYDFLKLIK